MKRFALGAMVLVTALVLTGCPGTPAGYQPPTVDSFVVSPQPALPGGAVVFHIEAHDDGGINSVVPRNLYTPTGTKVNVEGDECTVQKVPQASPGYVSITVTCTVPTVASNGTWQFELLLNDSLPPTGNYPGLLTRIPFEVSGGSEDHSPPQLLGYSIEPSTVDQETPFTLTMHVRDEAFPIKIGQGGFDDFAFTKLFAPNSTFECDGPTYTPVTTTDMDIVVVCWPQNFHVSGRAEAGLHRAFPPISDALGQETYFEMFVDVQPA